MNSDMRQTPGFEHAKLRSVFGFFAAAAATLIAAGSWAPFHFQAANFEAVWNSFVQSLHSVRWSRSDLVVNFWLGFPLTIGLCGWLRVHSGKFATKLFPVAGILLLQSGLSLTVELGQGWIAGRVPSATDFVFQIAGAFVALVGWQLVGQWLETRIESVYTNSSGDSEWTRLDAALGLLVAGILIWTVMPLDIIVSPADLAREAAKTEIVPFTSLQKNLSKNVYQWVASFLLAFPLGVWLSRQIAARVNKKLSWFSVILAGVATGILPELAQFPIDSRVTSATDAFFGTLGALTGIIFSSLFQATRFDVVKLSSREFTGAPGFWFLLATLQTLVLLAVAWMPFDFSTDTTIIAERLKHFQANPFSGYRGSDLLNGLTIFRQAILAAILGLFLGLGLRALQLKPRSSVLVMFFLLITVTAVACVVELGQLVIDSRSGEMLGTLVRTTGASLGLASTWIVRKQNPLAI